MARKMKGMKLHGGVAPKGTTGGGPNGSAGLSNSARQVEITGIAPAKMTPPPKEVLLQRARRNKARVAADEARTQAEGKGPSLDMVRRKKRIAKF